MTALLFIVPIAALTVAVIWDLAANPFRIERKVMGTPPREVFFVYGRGPQIASDARFYSQQEAEDWVATATAIKRGLPLPVKKD